MAEQVRVLARVMRVLVLLAAVAGVLRCLCLFGGYAFSLGHGWNGTDADVERFLLVMYALLGAFVALLQFAEWLYVAATGRPKPRVL